MAKTYWNKISVIEKSIADGDPTYLHEFIDILAKRKLLTGHMLMAICEATHASQRGSTKVHNLLHEFANDKIK